MLSLTIRLAAANRPHVSIRVTKLLAGDAAPPTPRRDIPRKNVPDTYRNDRAKSACSVSYRVDVCTEFPIFGVL